MIFHFGSYIDDPSPHDHNLTGASGRQIGRRLCIGDRHQAEVDVVLGRKESKLLERALLSVKTIEILCDGHAGCDGAREAWWTREA